MLLTSLVVPSVLSLLTGMLMVMLSAHFPHFLKVSWHSIAGSPMFHAVNFISCPVCTVFCTGMLMVMLSAHFPHFLKVSWHSIAGSPMFHAVNFISCPVCTVFAYRDADGNVVRTFPTFFKGFMAFYCW